MFDACIWYSQAMFMRVCGGGGGGGGKEGVLY